MSIEENEDMGGKNILKRIRMLLSWWGQKVVGGFPGGTEVKKLPTSAEDAREVGLISGFRRSPGEGNSNPFQYFCLENSMDRGAWSATVHGSQRVRHD